VQARALGLFGVNVAHGYLDDCPGTPCELTKPIGGALGLAVGYEWDGLALEGWGLLLMDFAPTRYTARERVPDPSAADAGGDSGGSIVGDVDIDFEIGPDGISIGADAEGAGETDGQAAAELPTVIRQRPADALLMRYGAGLGLGLRGLWGSRPARLTAALSAGILRRGVLDVSEFWDSEARAYTAPVLMLDAGVALGKTASVYLGLFGLAEFTGKVVLDDVAGHAQVVVSRDPQVYIGPLLAVQWGPSRDD
jgi:hypothetical protein